MQFWTVEEIERHAMADHEVGEEIAPGVTITRRQILKMGVAGLAVLSGAGCASVGRKGSKAADAAPDALSIEQLLTELRPEAMRLIASEKPDEPAYLAAVSKLLTRFRPNTPWAAREPREGEFSMAPFAAMPPVIVLNIHMRPGSKIDLHDHRHYNGVLYCTEGSVRCRNFDIVQPDGQRLDVVAGEVPPKDEDFLIRQSSDATLRPGIASMLSRDRDNIHHVEAGPDGCQLTDLFTYFRREARSYGLDWDEKPLSRGSDLYQVRWKG